jgi:hypothetical protein
VNARGRAISNDLQARPPDAPRGRHSTRRRRQLLAPRGTGFRPPIFVSDSQDPESLRFTTSRVAIDPLVCISIVIYNDDPLLLHYKSRAIHPGLPAVAMEARLGERRNPWNLQRSIALHHCRVGHFAFRINRKIQAIAFVAASRARLVLLVMRIDGRYAWVGAPSRRSFGSFAGILPMQAGSAYRHWSTSLPTFLDMNQGSRRPGFGARVPGQIYSNNNIIYIV